MGAAKLRVRKIFGETEDASAVEPRRRMFPGLLHALTNPTTSHWPGRGTSNQRRSFRYCASFNVSVANWLGPARRLGRVRKDNLTGCGER
jgi:hypothetical protein